MNWLYLLLLNVLRYVQAAGVQLGYAPAMNFGSGLTVVLNQALNRYDITATGASGTPVTAVAESSSFNVASPATNTFYNVTSSASLTATVTGMPTDGVVLTFVDMNQAWQTYPFTFASQAGGTVRNPTALGSADGGSATLNLAGSSQSWKWNATGAKWTAL